MSEVNIWAIVPAAGIGSRFGSDIPKQYAPLNNQTVLEQTLKSLLSWPKFKTIAVALSQNDSYWKKTFLTNESRIHTVNGGAERFLSVLNALDYLESMAHPNDWVMVHDAVRPCLQKEDIEKLYQSLKCSNVGGILAAPITDTVKQVTADLMVDKTLDRQTLWRALTPQMFRFSLLQNALRQSLNQSVLMTDEAQAVELAGHTVEIVPTNAFNIKITHPFDLKMAELALKDFND